MGKGRRVTWLTRDGRGVWGRVKNVCVCGGGSGGGGEKGWCEEGESPDKHKSLVGKSNEMI